MRLHTVARRMNGRGASVAMAGTLNASLVATAVTGVAPLAVQFDAIASASTRISDMFRQAIYDFSYGDTGASGVGNWPHSGLPKNSDTTWGPLGGHVYEEPGTYTATVQVFDGFEVKTQSVTITVLDPNVVYAGASTICISTDASTGWGPAGATYQTALPTGTGWNGKRVLFKRGQDFSGLGTSGVYNVPAGNHNVLIGAAGAGAQPILPHFNFNYFVPTARRGGPEGPADTHHHWTFHDVRIWGSTWGASSDATFYKCTLTGVPEAVNPGNELSCCFFGSSLALAYPTGGWTAADYPVPSRLSIVACEIGAGLVNNCRVLTYMNARQAFLAGNTYSGGAIEHGHRSPWYWKLYDCHNNYGGYTALVDSGVPAGPGKSRRTSRSGGFSDGSSERSTPGVNLGPDDGWDIAQRYVIIANNKIGDSLDVNDPSYPLEISAQNDGFECGSEDILVFGNRIYPSGDPTPSGTVEQNMAICGRRFTYFNNFKGDTSTPVGVTLNWKPTGVPVEWRGPYYTSRA